MSTWSVDGTNQLFNRRYFTAWGAPAAKVTGGAAFSGITSTTNTATVNYTGAGFNATVLYSLFGGSTGTGTADLNLQIVLNNPGLSALDFHFFQYADFDLAGTAGNDVGTHVNANLIRQTGDGVNVGETVVIQTLHIGRLGHSPASLIH